MPATCNQQPGASEHEEWRMVEEWDSLYEVSNLGRVRSLDRIDRNNRLRKGKILSLGKVRGYLQVSASLDGQMYKMRVHKLVLTTFVGRGPDGTQVNHKNGVKDDNRLENLEWVTPKENVAHSFKVLGRANPIPPRHLGDSHPRAKLNWAIVPIIRREVAAKQSTKAELARRYGVGETTIDHVIKGDTWTKRTFDTGDVRTVVQVECGQGASA